MDKLAALHALGSQRERSPYSGYRTIADFHGGTYGPDFVMFILQDWGSEDALSKPLSPAIAELDHDPNRTINIRLKDMLKRHVALKLADVHATNVFALHQAGMCSFGTDGGRLAAAAAASAICDGWVSETAFSPQVWDKRARWCVARHIDLTARGQAPASSRV